jgi:hypothetical protein
MGFENSISLRFQRSVGRYVAGQKRSAKRLLGDLYGPYTGAGQRRGDGFAEMS